MENYQEVKDDMALLMLIEVVNDQLNNMTDNQSKEFKEFVAKIEVIKDILVNL